MSDEKKNKKGFIIESKTNTTSKIKAVALARQIPTPTSSLKPKTEAKPKEEN
ncbi:hypothetical protein OIU80_19345 [Flavobacterium sp. LS1R47]|uniref:Uncharacterized protein n=1 Tax=Flavobacterium frigoritolerans TaxID=2987686 RepID=A0A9X3CA62_9FLAO|nr:hypothetical protein [Flavobacterium frigoritolerans]MCV9934441.1 hypothetical protein [Flavobacterium frigoritolerans]